MKDNYTSTMGNINETTSTIPILTTDHMQFCDLLQNHTVKTSTSSKPASFTCINKDPHPGRFGLESLEIIPRLLVERFGEPSPGDGIKVSGKFIFMDDGGITFIIYDWKETTLYWGADSSSFSPQEFWDIDEIVTLQVAGHSRNRIALSRFFRWLDDALFNGLQPDRDWLAGLPVGPCSSDNEGRLLRLLENGDTKTQLAALYAVRRIGEPIAKPHLLECLTALLRLQQPVRPEVIKTLSVFAGQSSSNWVQAYVLRQLNSESAEVRNNGLILLSALGASVWSDQVLARFAPLMLEEPTADTALLNMHRILPRNPPPPTPQIVLALARQLNHRSVKIRDLAAAAVVTLGKAAAVPEVLIPLFRMLGERNEHTRVAAEIAFEKLATVAAIPGLVQHLSESVKRDDFHVKASALRVARSLMKLTGEIDAGSRLLKLIKIEPVCYVTRQRDGACRGVHSKVRRTGIYPGH